MSKRRRELRRALSESRPQSPLIQGALERYGAAVTRGRATERQRAELAAKLSQGEFYGSAAEVQRFKETTRELGEAAEAVTAALDEARTAVSAAFDRLERAQTECQNHMATMHYRQKGGVTK